jgi:NO-binding membrane sensor protein with MHYT domain
LNYVQVIATQRATQVGTMDVAATIDRIVGCVSTQHDNRLVVLAVVICLFSCFTACGLIQRMRKVPLDHAWPWLAAAASVFSAGVWVTHFIAVLAYSPGLPIAFDVGWTMLSFVVAAVLTAAGLSLAVRGQTTLSGVALGVAIGVMHYSGMHALQVPADFIWEPSLVAASLLVAAGLCAAGMRELARQATWRSQLAGTSFLVLAICGLHFTAMAALTLVPNPVLSRSEALASNDWLAACVSIVVAAIIAAGQGAMLIDVRLARAELQAARGRLAAALETLPVAIALFDCADRLVSFNATYLRIHEIIADILQPGTSFETILRTNVARSRFDLGDQERRPTLLIAWRSIATPTAHSSAGSLMAGGSG